MRKILYPGILGAVTFFSVLSFNSFGQTYTCDYEMVAINNSSHGCNNGGINTTLPSNIYPSLEHDVYYNGSFVTVVSLAPFAGTTFFSTVFFNGYGLGNWEYYAHYTDESGNKVDCNYHQVIVSEPACNLTITGFTTTNGAVCSSGQVSGTVTGNFCGQWTNTLYSGSLDGPVVYTNNGVTTPAAFTVTNLPSGTYYARITDGGCTSEYSTPVNSCPKPTSGFATSNISSSQAKVKWDIVSCALSYQVRYRVTGTTTWTNKSTTANVGNKVLKGLLPSTMYEWEVRSKCFNNPAIWSAWTAKKTFTTAALRAMEQEETVSENMHNLKLDLLPNPSHDHLTILFESDAATADLQIFNLSGQIVWSERITTSGGVNNQSIDISKFPGGLYYLLLRADNGFANAQFVKE